MKTKIPCKSCLVSPMCVTICEELIDIYMKKLYKMDIYINSRQEFHRRVQENANFEEDVWINYSHDGKYVRTTGYRLNLWNVGMVSVHVKYGRMIEAYSSEKLELPF